MTRASTAWALLAIGLAMTVACGSDAAVEDAADTVAADTTAGDLGGADVDNDAALVDTTPAPGEFEFGTNVAGTNDPSAFTPIVDGDELTIEFGFQGLWMVVVAFRTRNIFDGPLRLDADITVAGTEQGSLVLADQKLAVGPGGWGYYYNFFLVVDDPTVSGQDGLITLVVTDGAQQTVRLERTVALTGGQ